MVRSRRKPIILHGYRGCGAEFNFTAWTALDLEPSRNMQSDLRVRIGRAIGDPEELLNNSRSCHRFQGLVYHKVVLGGPCAETSPLQAK